jgi:hypothetical protein
VHFPAGTYIEFTGAAEAEQRARTELILYSGRTPRDPRTIGLLSREASRYSCTGRPRSCRARLPRAAQRSLTWSSMLVGSALPW